MTPAPALRFGLRALFGPIDRLRDRIGFVQSAIALMLIGFLALLFIMAMSLWLGERSQYFFNGALEARSTWNAVSELRHALQTAEASQRGYIVTGNQVYLAPYGTAKAQASRQLAAVDRLLQPVAEARQSLDRLKAIVSEKFAEMDRTIGLKRDRRDDEALAIFRTNRGKALTDEANVFLSSMIRAADARLTEGVVEVRENALLLRLATILSGILIVLVMAGVIVTVVRYTRALASARDEVATLNTGLEQRVEERTAELARARDRAELLLAEVNHRVANSLALVGSMVSLQARSAPDERTRGVLDEVQARIYAIASVHKRIYSSGDVRFVALDEYLSGLLENLETSMHSAGHGAVLSERAAARAAPHGRQHQSGRGRDRVGHQRVQICLSRSGGRGSGAPQASARGERRAHRRGRRRRPRRRGNGTRHRPRHQARHRHGSQHGRRGRVPGTAAGHGGTPRFSARGGMTPAFSMSGIRTLAVLCAVAGAVPSASVPALAQQGPPGIVEPTVFPAHDPDVPACTPPPGLERALGFARDNDRDFMRGVDYGLARAAGDRRLAYRLAVANNDSALMVSQIEAFHAGRFGGVVAAPVDPASLAPHLQKLIWSGSYVGTIVPPPATSLLNAPQYLTGKALGDAAADHIRTRLDGKANVVLLTHDSLEFLAPRFAAIRDSLQAVPDATIVADISPVTVNKEGGFAMMNTILLAVPEVDVVLGADTVVLGALEAVRKAGKARPDQFFGGIDGEPEAVAELKTGTSPYKTSISLASPVFGYAMGQHAADWLEGKSIPQAMDILPIALNARNIAQYEADLADPAAVYADPERRARYLRMYGNICYDTRDRYVNFPWSSETK